MTDARSLLMQPRRSPAWRRSRRRASVGFGPVVAVSLVAGLVTAAAFTLVAFAGAEEHVITGTAMLAFALGWALLAAGSARWTDQPQRWAAVPAGLMGLVGYGPAGPCARRRRAPDPRLGLAARAPARSSSGCSSAPAGSCVAAPAGGCCTPFSPFWPWRRSAALSRRHESRCTGGASAGGRPTGRRSAATALYLELHGFRQPRCRAGSGARWKLFRMEDGRAGCRLPDQGLQLRPCRQRSERERYEVTDGIQTATDLRTLLSRAGEPGPYVLVGHSLGGAYVLDFARAVSDAGRRRRAGRLDEPGSVHEAAGLRRHLRRHASSLRAAAVGGPTRYRTHRRLQRTRRTRVPRRGRRDPRLL